MNNSRRKSIQSLIDKLNDIKTDLEFIQEQESDAFDNLPESLQESERGEAMQNALDYLDEALSSLDEIIDSLESAKE